MINNSSNTTNGCYLHPKEVVVGVCAHCLKEKLLILLASKQGHHHHRHTNNNGALLSRRSSYSKIFDLGSFSYFLHRGRHRRLRRLESENHHKSHEDLDMNDSQDTSTSQEDSFISIKFQDDGVASWDKGTTNYTNNKVLSLGDEPSDDHLSATTAITSTCTTATTTTSTSTMNLNLNYKNETRETSSNPTTMGPKSVIEHVKPHGTSLRWQKRIGQVLQLIRWKRSNSSKTSNMHHHNVVKKVDGGGGGGGVKITRKKGWIRSLTKRKS